MLGTPGAGCEQKVSRGERGMGDRMKEMEMGGMVQGCGRHLGGLGNGDPGVILEGSGEQGCLEAGGSPATVVLGQF